MSEIMSPGISREHQGQWKKRRGLHDDPLRLHVVYPNGLIKQVAYAVNISSKLVDASGEGVRLSQWAANRGYTLLEDRYAEDGNESGWKMYLDWWQARCEGRLPMGKAGAFPDRLLPQSVVEQREVATTRNQWVPPDVEEA